MIEPPLRLAALTRLLGGLAALLVVRTLVSIVANYPDYFPPNFDSLFLQGREATFHGVYRVAFYIHILTSPFVLLSGLILLSETVRRRSPRFHRILGRWHVGILLVLMLPSGMAMCRHAFAGWPAGLSFVLLSIATGTCAVMGVVRARQRHFDLHRYWMSRCYLLICSAVALRLISGSIGLFETTNATGAYIVAAWASWLIPLAMLEIISRIRRISGIRP